MERDIKKEILASHLKATVGDIGDSITLLDVGSKRIIARKTTRTEKYKTVSEILLDLPYSSENEKLARAQFPLKSTWITSYLSPRLETIRSSGDTSFLKCLEDPQNNQL